MRDQNKVAYGGQGLEQRLDAGASFSGGERNVMFWNKSGHGFVKVSGVSGADSPADSRAFAVLDFNRDGRVDLAFVNANEPRFSLLENRILQSGERGATQNGYIAIRFIGGNDRAKPSEQWSNRNGYGVKVAVVVNGRTIVREHRAGDGLASQNSRTMIVGLGDAQRVERLTVYWPSGVMREIEGAKSGDLITVYENPAQAPAEATHVVEPYPVRMARPAPTSSGLDYPVANLPHKTAETDPPLRLYTTTATWCPNCLREIPHLVELRKAFGDDELAIYALPIDPKDTEAKLAAYVAKSNPPYTMLYGLTSAEREAVRGEVMAHLRVDALPAVFVVGPGDRLIHVGLGMPSVSEMKKYLRIAMDLP